MHRSISTSVAELGGVAACACNGKARTGEEVLYSCVHVLSCHRYRSMEISMEEDTDLR